VFFGVQVYAVVVRGQAFDPMAFGTGFGTLLGATAAGFGLRAHLTPNQSL
jgi:glycerol uptake facilitator-like aquaporin